MKKDIYYNSENDDIVLKVDNVSKEYILGAVTGGTLKDAVKEMFGKKGSNRNKRFTALDSVSFTAERGETIGLIGANGAGKSTLLKLISRITAPTKGKIYIDGRVASMLEVGTGFHPELTGMENIYLNGSILGMSKSEIDKKIESIIEFSEVREFIDTPVKRYSSGMYVKLAFAIASHLDAEIMIMDEVLAVGDVNFQLKCIDKMREIAKSDGKTVIYVSHNLDTVKKLCKRCIVLDHGKLCFDGDIDEAARIYYGYNDTSENAGKDLSQILRPGWLDRDDVRMTEVDCLGYEDDDNILRLKIHWRCNRDIDNLCFRFELFDEAERCFAISCANNFVSCKAGDTGETVMNIDLSRVVDGLYETHYTMFYSDAYRQGINVDWVKGMTVKINRRQKLESVKWDRANWGSVMLNPIKAENLK